MAIITELYHLPALEYFVAIQDYDIVYLDIEEDYQKQTYRNRTQIRLANKVETLSIPVIGGNKKVKSSQIRIDNSQKWKNVHLRGIQSAYGKAPYFEFYFPYFEPVYNQKWDLLADFNHALLTVCLKMIQSKTKLQILDYSDDLKEFNDFRGVIQTKKSFECRNIYSPVPYQQLFGLDFVPNLSIIDLLFCMGPETANILNQSQKKQ
ncbi:WbqC family protein [Belliella kenyensis]|uniref:WbqC family protein n=1 Tax=Belliella kenyensis TaxID=1472724 RepID=A0ABV8EN27_9BACT|nr:WbqC family protein [Belliella kenyensis]MCH7400555.1 WbqC family protein [Belliella kenyensis]MDN3602158.1 WbqC family protein [Belliella kenyensis]